MSLAALQANARAHVATASTPKTVAGSVSAMALDSFRELQAARAAYDPLYTRSRCRRRPVRQDQELDVACDLVEHTAEVGAQGRDGSNDRDRDQTGDQAVLDRGDALAVAVDGEQDSRHQ